MTCDLPADSHMTEKGTGGSSGWFAPFQSVVCWATGAQQATKQTKILRLPFSVNYLKCAQESEHRNGRMQGEGCQEGQRKGSPQGKWLRGLMRDSPHEGPQEGAEELEMA